MTDSPFTLLRRHRIESLGVELQDYRHEATGARHLHLAADDPHNVFLVAFRTVPQDSTGVAHILEHTALCGSRRYPVRDPFFMMIRRSLNTFMNAFTASDWTAYPFASLNRKDFRNLLEVYLDSAFFPLLDELDFAQEGHRLELVDPDDPQSPLTRSGVVYNEMKGAMSSPVSRLHQTLQSSLFPTITYHYNSGGEPADIPRLTHADLKAFQARHYHPSNAVFMTFGDIPASEHQALFQERVLSQFSALALDLAVPDEQRYDTPQRVSGSYPLDPDDDPANKTHVVLGWLLGNMADTMDVLRARILSGVLLDNSSSPLRHMLETSDLGTSPSPLCGFDDSNRETTFVAGLEGCEAADADAIEARILEVLEQVARDGVDPSAVDAVLHQLELSQREVTGDGFPYGLHLLLEALPAALHDGDPADALDLDPALEKLREEIRSPQFIPQVVRRLLLDNPHRVRLTLEPDPRQAEREHQAEVTELAGRAATLSADDRARIRERSEALKARQARQDDPEILPRVGLEDVPRELPIPEAETRNVGDVKTTWYAQPTNGMVYQQWVLELPQLPDELIDLLPLYAVCLPELGSGGRDYLQTQARQAAVTGGVSARVLIRGDLDDTGTVHSAFVIAGKALARNGAALADMLRDTLLTPRFDELERLRELISQVHAQREESVSDQGHALALTAASAGLSPVAALNHRWDGLGGLKLLRELAPSLAKAKSRAALAEKLRRIHEYLRQAPRQYLVVSEASQHAPLAEALAERFADLPATQQAPSFSAGAASADPEQRWVINAAVNFCAKAYPGVPPSHADAPALQVLGEYLRNTYLHRAIREQGGAYGGGANYNGDSGAFRFYSYRDPRLEETLADFDAAVAYVLEREPEHRAVEEAVLGVVGAIDRPGSPAGEAIGSFHAALFGRTPEQRRAFRKAVLDVTLDDLRRVAKAYLDPSRARTAVLGPAANLERLAEAS